MREFKLKLTDHGKGEVWIDGLKQEGVRAFTLSARAGETNILTVEFIAEQVEVDGVMDIDVTPLANEGYKVFTTQQARDAIRNDK